jgi:hypothetical protein
MTLGVRDRSIKFIYNFCEHKTTIDTLAPGTVKQAIYYVFRNGFPLGWCPLPGRVDVRNNLHPGFADARGPITNRLFQVCLICVGGNDV